jgi:hypothetical protein
MIPITMRTSLRFPLSTATGLAFAWLLVACPVGMFAQNTHKNPTSKFYVADLEGQSSLDTGTQVEDLKDKSVHSADGSTIETNPKSKSAVVLSNGTGVFIDPDTRMEVKRFMQEPFTPNRNDPEVEPSLSQTQASIPHGTVGLCTPKMVAGSTMVYDTPQASIAIRGRKVVIGTDGDQTTVSLLEGDVTVRGDQYTGGQTLKPGQQAIITRSSPTAPPKIVIQQIPPDQMKALTDRVTQACVARLQVFFQSVDPKNLSPESVFTQDDPTQQLVPKEIVPPTISPTYTVSPYFIPKP